MKKEWKKFEQDTFLCVETAWQKRILEYSEGKGIYAEIYYWDYPDNSIKYPYELHLQIPEEISITGTTIDVNCFLNFEKCKIDFSDCDKKANLIINKLICFQKI